jgi:hypothetical protein
MPKMNSPRIHHWPVFLIILATASTAFGAEVPTTATRIITAAHKDYNQAAAKSAPRLSGTAVVQRTCNDAKA